MRKSGWALALTLSLVAPMAPLAWADDVTPQAIVKALTPIPKPPLSRAIDGRGIVIDEEAPPPQIDLTINFEFNSSHLTPEGVAQLSKLGVALNDPKLKAFRFRIVGHTDAKGAPDYNMALSERRAHAVGAYLGQVYALEPGRLQLEGRGASELKDPANPEDGVNRRVQVVTLTQ